MKTILIILAVLVFLYCGAGVLMAFYEQSQTDNTFDWTTIIFWLPKMFG